VIRPRLSSVHPCPLVTIPQRTHALPFERPSSALDGIRHCTYNHAREMIGRRDDCEVTQSPSAR
jgi:hypothetical protein